MHKTLSVLVVLSALATGLNWHGHLPRDAPNLSRQTSPSSAQDLLSKSIAALGGEQALKALKGVTYSA